MKNYIGPGDTIELTAPDETDDVAVESGEGLVNGSIFGVATCKIEPGESGPCKVDGVFDLAKAPSQAWTLGVRVYWDAENKRATTTASSHKLIGVATKAVAGGAGDIVGRVKLTGAFTI